MFGRAHREHDIDGSSKRVETRSTGIADGVLEACGDVWVFVAAAAGAWASRVWVSCAGRSTAGEETFVAGAVEASAACSALESFTPP